MPEPRPQTAPVQSGPAQTGAAQTGTTRAVAEGALIERVNVPDAVQHADLQSAARACLRRLVARLAGVPEAGVRIEARCPDCGGPHGRPVVMAPPGARDVSVSLAYAGLSLVAAAASGRPIGVDAELRDQGPQTDARSQAIRILAPGSGDDPLRHWTRIEAVLKADGRGLRVDPRAVVFERRAAGLVAEVAEVAEVAGVAGIAADAGRYDVQDIDLGDDLVVSAALGL